MPTPRTPPHLGLLLPYADVRADTAREVHGYKQAPTQEQDRRLKPAILLPFRDLRHVSPPLSRITGNTARTTGRANFRTAQEPKLLFTTACRDITASPSIDALN